MPRIYVISDPPFSNPSDSDPDKESAQPLLQYDSAFELYSIQESGDDNVSEIILHPNQTLCLTPLSIYKAPQPVLESEPSQKKQKVTQPFLKLLGPKYHLTADPQHFIFRSKLGVITHKLFVLDWDLDWIRCCKIDEVNTLKIRPNIESNHEITVCYEWIETCVRANFEFSIIFDEDDSTQHPIKNLEGDITVTTSCTDGTTRMLGLFEKDDVISGEPLTLLRSHAAFQAGDGYIVNCDLSFLVDGTHKNITATQSFRSVLENHCVFTKEEFNEAKDCKELHQESFIGNEYPMLQMKVLWLTNLVFGD